MQKKIEALITEKTSAILPVHVYGNICNVEEIDKIAPKYNLKVIYDAAHTFGETYKNKGVGLFGDAACFSFRATKLFNTIEGGAVSFRDEELGEKLYDLKNFGIHGPEHITAVGANAKMNEFCAAMGICNLKHIDEEITKRKIVAERYRVNLEGIGGIRMNLIDKNVKSNYAYFPAFFEPDEFGANCDDVKASLESEGILTRKYFFPLTSTFEAFGGRFSTKETPTAIHCSNNVLCLPLYADLPLEVVDRISEIIIDLGRQNQP